MRKRIELTNKRFGRLTVKEFSHSDKRKASYWKCECDCSNQTTVRSNSLIGGKVVSCGCYQKELLTLKRREVNDRTRLPPGECNFNIVFVRYIRNAKKHNRQFTLTKEQGKQLMTSPCHYCHILPAQIENTKNTNQPFVYNGIDRKNNDIGYIIENCLSCCGECNWMKGTMNYDKFIYKIKQIAGAHEKKS